MNNNESPNLFDFLRDLKGRANSRPVNSTTTDVVDKDLVLVAITQKEIGWLESFLTPADIELHFKGRRVGGTDDNPEVAQDYMIAGAEVDIFSLLTEAMLQNPTFASLIQAAAKFYQDHVPTCPDCQATLLESMQRAASWEFKPHKLEPARERESPCTSCDIGEMIFQSTHPNGQSYYTCNNCGKEESWP